jgi:excisionase family DNA binding protein
MRRLAEWNETYLGVKNMVKEIMDVKKIAKYLGFGEKKIYQLIENGEIPVSKIGGQYRFLKRTIDQWLEEKQGLSKKVKKEIKINQLLRSVKETSDPLQKRLLFIGVLTKTLEKEKIKPIIVGGHAVEFYTVGGYSTRDIDIVFSDQKLLNKKLLALGFKKENRHWYNQKLDIAIESPASGLSEEEYERITIVNIQGLTVQIIGIEDIIIDRLNAYVHWKSIDDGYWARELLLMYEKEIDKKYLEKRCKEEGTIAALKKLKRKKK